MQIRFINARYGYTQPLLQKSITFSVSNGESVNIVGPKGTGKSTLLELLKSLSAAKLYSGRVILVDEEANEYRPEEIDPEVLSDLIQFVSQGDDLLLHRTLAENLSSEFHLNPDQRKKLAEAAKIKVDEEHRQIHLYHQLPWRIKQKLPSSTELIEVLVKTGLWNKLGFTDLQILNQRRFRDGWRIRSARRRYLDTQAPAWWARLKGDTVYEAVTGTPLSTEIECTESIRVRCNHITGDIEILVPCAEGEPDHLFLFEELELTDEQWALIPGMWRALELVGAREDLEQHDMWLFALPDQLSGGQQKLQSIARALMSLEEQTRIIVLDEALSQLNAAAADRVLKGLSTIRKQLIILAVAHSPEAIPADSRVVLLTKDGIAAEGTKKNLEKKGSQHPYNQHFYPQGKRWRIIRRIRNILAPE